MKDEYDFSDSVKNPYSQALNKSKTMSLEDDVILGFQKLAKVGRRNRDSL